MKGEAHLIVGTLGALPLALGTHELVPVVAGAALGSLLPDVDSPHSTFGRWCYVPLRHHGPVHSVLAGLVSALLALVLVLAQLPADWRWAPAGLLIGFALHLACDRRVSWLWPWRRRRRRSRAV